mgnify:CR=1 FL=1
MTIKEFHIKLDIGLQRLNSKIFKNLRDEEKDILIYWGTLNFIKSQISDNLNLTQKGFDESIFRLDSLNEIKKTVTLPIYTVEPNSNIYKVFRPKDYLHYVRSNTNSYNLCKLNSVTPNNLNISDSYRIAIVNMQNFSIFPALNNFSNFVITTSDDVLPTPTVTIQYKNTKNVQNIVTNAGSFDFINFIIDDFNAINSNIEVYFERFADIYKPYCLIFVYKDLTLNYNSIMLSTIVESSQTINNSNFTGTFETISYNKLQNNTITTFVNGNNIPVSSEKVDLLNSTTFHKTTKKNILITFENSFIKIFADSSFLPKDFKLTYLKKPRINNIFANITCELNENVHYAVLESTLKLASVLIQTSNLNQINSIFQTN